MYVKVAHVENQLSPKQSSNPALSRKTHQGQCHSHDDRGEDEIEGGDLKHVAVRVWVCVDVLILSRHVQRFGTTILLSILEDKRQIKHSSSVTTQLPGVLCFRTADIYLL